MSLVRRERAGALAPPTEASLPSGLRGLFTSFALPRQDWRLSAPLCWQARELLTQAGLSQATFAQNLVLAFDPGTECDCVVTY